jgi:Tol biopolymer transport system component
MKVVPMRRALLVLLAATLMPGAAEAAFPGKNGRIAFTAQTEGDRGELVSSRIETVLPSGRGRRELGICPDRACLDVDPVWSPSGRALAFGRGAAFQSRLAIVRSDGTGLRELPQTTQSDTQPAWSPGGRRLAFIGEGSRLFTVRTDGTRPRQVPARSAYTPAWSMTGRIAYAHDDDFYRAPILDDGLYTTRPDGSRERLLVRDRYNASSPSSPDWSPHGRRIAFAFADSADFEVHVVDATGRRHRRLTFSGGADPAWSPDGRYIAFIRNFQDLYVMRPNGRGLRRVATGGLTESGEQVYLSSPSWQPLRR